MTSLPPTARIPVRGGPEALSAPEGDERAPFREYLAAHPEVDRLNFMEGVSRILDDRGPDPPREARAAALLRLLEAFPLKPGRTLMGHPHAEILRSVGSVIAPPRSQYDTETMTVESYFTSYRERDSMKAAYRRPEKPLAGYSEALEDYVDLARRLAEGGGHPPGDLGAVCHGAIHALQVEYQHLYRDPVLTPLFREALAATGRADFALGLARMRRDDPSADLLEGIRAVKDLSGSMDGAFRAVRLAAEERRPGETVTGLAVTIHQTWLGVHEVISDLAKRYPGVPRPKADEVVLRSVEGRTPGEPPPAVARRLLEGWFLVGSFEGPAVLDRAFEARFPPGTVPDELRGRMRGQLTRSMEARRRDGITPDQALARALDDIRFLLPGAEPKDGGTIEADDRRVRIGEVDLDVRR